jgi:cell division transport system permease protein
MTLAVIGIALALPSGLYVLLKNLQVISGGWENTAKISLFLKQDTSFDALEKLARRLQAQTDIAHVQVITADDALRDFRESSGFGEALDALGENPLPHALVITPAVGVQQTNLIKNLFGRLKQLAEVDMAQLDMKWLHRLNALVDIARRGVIVVAATLAVAVLLVVGNTIRLDIQNRRDEIEITRLVGATDAFVRRPFLYSGLWYGMFGGIFAWVLVFMAMVLVDKPAQRLAELYDSQYRVAGLGGYESLILLVSSITLGLLGSWLAVGRHLRKVEMHQFETA